MSVIRFGRVKSKGLFHSLKPEKEPFMLRIKEAIYLSCLIALGGCGDNSPDEVDPTYACPLILQICPSDNEDCIDNRVGCL
jgi:hypothetical protein